VISIFNGRRHRLGEGGKTEIYVEVEVALRDHLHCFKPAEFMVFMAIALRINSNGEAFPSYDQLQEDTGMHRATIAKAVKGLTELTIEGHPVLSIRREHNERGLLVGNNIYQVFPDSSVLRTSIQTNVRVVALEEEPVLKEETKTKNNGGVVVRDETTAAASPLPSPSGVVSLNGTGESAIWAALEKLNQGIKRGGGNPITGTKVIAARLAQRGVTIDEMRTAWKACKANAENPVGAFVFWTREEYTPPPKKGFESKTDEQGNHVVWVDGQGWMTVTGSHV
jgi:hypothetical protein